MTLFSRLVWLQLLVWTAAAAFRISSSSSYRPSLSLAWTFSRNKRTIVATTPWTIPRGGSTNVSEDDEEEESEDEEEVDLDEEEMDEDEESDNEDEESDEEEDNPLNTVISSEPLKVSIKTNLGSPLVDTSLELLVSRTRNVGSIKKSVSKQMPGRPPIAAQQLLLDGRELHDDLLVDELVEDDEDDDDDEDSLKLVLNMVPPVDPKFATDFLERTKSMSTSDLLDAYAANAAAMYHNSQLLLLSDDNDDAIPKTNLRKETLEIREMMVQSMPEEALELLKEQEVQDENPLGKQRRGQRLRTGRGGAKQSTKSVLQRNLNINWSDTIRNFILFLLFGIFGGRNTVSKHLLLLGAPLCFVLQARPVKIWLKLGFYLARDPPSILLSLLPAPQQAILSFDEQESRTALYGPVENDGNEEGEGEEEEMEQDNYDDDYDDEEMEQDDYDDYNDEEMEQEEFDDYDDETEDDYD